MSQSPYNQSVALTANEVATVTVPVYYERIIVANLLTAQADDVYVATNGQAVSASEGGFGAVVLPGAWRMIGNDQPRQPLVSKTAPGSTTQNTSFGGSTTPSLNLPASGYPTYISLISPASGSVSLEFV